MKKLFLLAALVLGFATVKAQTGVSTMPFATSDSVINTGTASKVITTGSGYSGIAVQAIITKISGTTVAGTVSIYGSNDNSNFTKIGSDFTLTNVATQGNMFYVQYPLPAYLKVSATGSGTESLLLTVNYRYSVFRTY